MPLTLVLGPGNSAKAGEVLGAFAAAAHRRALLVVPNAADAEHYSRELAEQGSVLASVVTFRGLTAEIARRCGYAARQLTPLQREQLVRRAVRGANLKSLAPAAATRGFAPAAGELLAELERSLISPKAFASGMRRWGSDRGSAQYAAELSSIYAAYDRELERAGRVDRELFAWRTFDALRREPGRWGSDPVFFYGFDDLHPLQRDAVETLARVVRTEVMVSLTYEAGRSALQARAEVVEELKPLAEEVLELPGVDDYYEPEARHVLSHLERHLFAATAKERVEPGDAVKLLESAGELSEAELVAAEVIALGRAGIEAKDIAIIHRSPQGMAPVLASVFRQYGLPLALERRLTLAQTALGRGLRALARCALLPEDQRSAQDLLDYLRTPGILPRPEIADALELRVRCEGLRTGEAARERSDLRLGEIDALAQTPAPAAELARQARRLLAAPNRATGRVLEPEEELDAAACAALLESLTELEELELEPAAEDLLELLERIEVVVPPAGDPRAPLLTEPLAIRARRFRAVIVCGLEEGEFPRPASPEPFLSDEQRREVAAAGLRLPQREDALERERYLFYSALSRATARVVLSYRSSDEEGNLQLPSPFIADVAELLVEDWPKRRARRLLSDVVWPEADAPTARERVLAQTAAAARSQAADARGQGGNGKAARKLSPRALSHVRHTEILSAGALESYADCPVKWLVERELRPQSLEPEGEAIVRGSFMHGVLERVLGRLGGAVTAASLPDALRILDEVLAAGAPSVASGQPEALRRAALEAITADLRRYLAHEAESGCAWDPLRLELRFGFDDEDSLAPLELEDDSERVAVRGAIDRVDVDPDGRHAVIRDYKSSGSRPEHQAGRWSSERRLQVALYMLAVRDLLGLEPVAGLYQPLRGRDLRARGIFLEGEDVGAELVSSDSRDREGLEAELGDAARRAVELAARLRSGEVRPCPATCSREGCRYPGICRSG